MEFRSTVVGIPCVIRVDHYASVPGSGNRWTAASDLDCYGYTECDFTVLDRRGRPAPWLERKLTAEERERIESEIRDEADAAAADWAEDCANYY